MKKILVIHHAGNLGGGTLSCFDVILALKSSEYNIILALPPGDSLAKNKAKSMNIEIMKDAPSPIIFSYYNGSTNILKAIIKFFISYRNKKKWEAVFEKERPDLVILNSMVQWPLLSILYKKDIKSICFVRETMKGKPNKLINCIIKRHLSIANGVSFLSKYDLNQWDLPNSVNKVVIPDLVDICKFKINISKEMCRNKLALKNDVFYILYVGGMSKLKGVNTLIKAIKELSEKNIELLFLGDLGNDLIKSRGFNKVKSISRVKFIKRIKNYIKKNNLNRNINFVGLKSNMNYWYAACDIVVFPAEKAHQARPIYEAGVFKKPVIVSNFPNYYDYLIPEESGLVFEPGNFKELAKAIERLYIDPVLCNQIGENNYKLMKKYHDSKEVNNIIKNFIENVL